MHKGIARHARNTFCNPASRWVPLIVGFSKVKRQTS
jgi:hypothetical protein